jgi:2-amino-4-hydroxy-6-hydroxymethyldihydropteridine diphosphokinase
MSTAYIGLGANLGDAQNTVRLAIAALGTLPDTRSGFCSSLYLTAPIDADGADYVNAVAEITTMLSPADLLLALQHIERQSGRVRTYQNAPRTLDCDLLLYDQKIIHSATLQVPHPRMHLRAFVLVPLLEIAPEIVLPGIGPASSMLAAVSHQSIQKVA